MPIVLIGDTTGKRTEVYRGTRIPYDYPHKVDFSPQGKLHHNIVTKLLQLAEESFQVMSERHKHWQYVDEMMTAFIPLSDYEKALKQRGGGKDQFHGRNRPVSVVVPYSYATFETIMTYLTQAFFQSPIFQYGSVGPEDTIKAKLLELVVDAQTRYFKGPLSLHTSLGDGLKYGIGASTFEWREVFGKRPILQEVQEYDETGRFLGTSTERVNEKALLFEGNKINPIDPYRLLLDPNVSSNDVQDGEFCGWISIGTYYDLMEQERDDEEVFNVKYLDSGHFRQRFSKFTTDNSYREKRNTGSSGGPGIKTNWTNYITQVHMFVRLIPREWGLPGDPLDNKNGVYPEKWLFTLANDLLLIRATRHNLNHNRYPIAVVSPDADGYSSTPIGRMEMLHGLQEGMNWLYNSHIANVRKAINDMLIVDPSLVVMKDLQNPEPGKLVRIRRKNWGRGVENAVMQLKVTDVTQGNIGDSMHITDMMQRVSAAVDAVQGIVRSGGERRSATEYRMTVSNALSRLEHIAKMASMQYLQDMSYLMASHTQQFMSRPVSTQILGEWPEALSKIYERSDGVHIDVHDILVDYDIIVRDGSVPTAGVANADLLVQLFQTVAQQPELMQQFDITRLFTRIATMLGDKNAFDFIRKGGNVAAVTAPDEDVLRQAEAGNLIPTSEV